MNNLHNVKLILLLIIFKYFVKFLFYSKSIFNFASSKYENEMKASNYIFNGNLILWIILILIEQ